MAEKMASYAELAAAAGAEHVLIEPGPALDRINVGRAAEGSGGVAP